MSNESNKAQLLALFLFTLLNFGLCRAQAPKPTPHSNKPSTITAKTQGLPFDTAREMTVAVIRKSSGFDQLSVGSAVWVGNNGYLATCSHVIGSWTGPIAIGMSREPFVSTDEHTLVAGGVMNIFDVTVVANDPSTDVAILKANIKPSEIHSGPLATGMASSTPQSPLSAKGAALETDFPRAGQTLLLAGYPLSEKTLILQTGISTGIDFLKVQGTFDTHMQDHLRIMLSLVSNPGNSGGPVFNDAGKVIGLLEGNLQAPIRDNNGNDLSYQRQKTDQFGKVMADESGKPIIESAPYLQNSGISLAIPAKFITRLGLENRLSLE